MAEALDLQAILRHYLPTYRQHHPLDPRRLEVLSHLLHCRSEAMGGLHLQCEPCRHDEVRYYACRDRHCPKCQWRAAQQWAHQQLRHQLPVSYHHLVFTLPETLNGWIELHPQVLYRLLFQAVWATLRAFGEDPKRLGGQLGMTAVLHTWGSTLVRHVHLHCLVAGGALTLEGEWKPSKAHYLFPVRALSRRFRGQMVSRLRACAAQGQLTRITRAGEIDATLNALMARDWVVYSKPAMQAGQHVIEYLARYTHRSAISNARLLGLEHDRISFRYKNYRKLKWQVMQLDAEVFIQRLLLHVLPKGLMRIRHYGFLANACRAKQLARIRHALVKAQSRRPEKPREETQVPVTMPHAYYPCSGCHQPMRIVAEIAPRRLRWEVG